MKRITRGDRYYRVCDPEWPDPLDTGYSRRDGGRWNAPDTFGLLHLNATIGVAAANARSHYENEVHTLFDLQPAFRPVLIDVDVAASEFCDCVTEEGLLDVGLPADYPANATWVRTRSIGARAERDATIKGIAARSAVLPEQEELAVFDRSLAIVSRPKRRRRFDAWYPPLRPPRRSRPQNG